MGIFDVFKTKPREPQPEDFLTRAGPTKKAAEEYEKAHAKWAPTRAAREAEELKEAKKEKPTIMKITTAMPFASTQRQKEIFDPSRQYPTFVPYWAKQRKRVI